MIAGEKLFFGFDKSFRAHFLPQWNGAHNMFLSFRHRKIIDDITGKISTLMTAEIALWCSFYGNRQRSIFSVNQVRTTSPAVDLIHRNAICFG